MYIQSESSKTANEYVPAKLRSLMLAANAKILRNRFKSVLGKWHPSAYSHWGQHTERTWSTAPIPWLCRKLAEEFIELVVEGLNPTGDQFKTLDEAGDVAAMAMMLADRKRVFDVLPPTIVTLCGSTRFKDEFENARYEETMAGNIVLTVGFFHHVDTVPGVRPQLTPGEKVRLDVLHKRKIDISDEILVINPGDYIGESTAGEILHARSLCLPIRYMFAHDPATEVGKHWESKVEENWI